MLSTTRRLALLSRLLIVGIQFVANHMLSDHDARVFLSPVDATNAPLRPFDAPINALLGGFRRWDAQYYLHIAEHGYTYENTLAFYPLLPGVLNICARFLHNTCGLHTLVSFRELLLVLAIMVNIAAFCKASQTLHRLTELVFRNAKLAQTAALLFAFNPASVFFTAPYSESLFAWQTFATMELCQRKRYAPALVPLCLSIACRSNGTINLGFLLFHVVHDALSLPGLARHLRHIATALIAAVASFASIQYYQYTLFCVDDAKHEFAPSVRAYGDQQAFVMAGEFTKWNSSWCHSALPMPYTFVQQHYWKIGWFAYYELKQIPNFALAAPIVYVFARGVFAYGRRQCAEMWRTPVHLYHLFKLQRTVDQRLFVYVVHAMALTLICVCFVHIQVSTRLLASASPCLYWFCAVRWEGAVRPLKLVRDNRWLCVWFLGYCTVGTVLFSNFLPWT